jgi:NADPH:quinone reductase-like Zn-dependent oxidoreductase
MKAIQLQAFGNGADGVRLVDLPEVPAPAAGEVVIAVEAARSPGRTCR